MKPVELRTGSMTEKINHRGHVRFPVARDEAKLMVLMGMQYLERHSPEDLREPLRTTNALLRQAWELSTWAGSINWRGGENQKEWLNELRNLIERFQAGYRDYAADACVREGTVISCDAAGGQITANSPAPDLSDDVFDNIIVAVLTGVDKGDVKAYLAKALAEYLEWQPMDTAPRDGTRIIIFCKWSGDCARAHWDDGLWMTYSGGIEEDPTGWLRLPPVKPGMSKCEER